MGSNSQHTYLRNSLLHWARVWLSLSKPVYHSQHRRNTKQRPLYQFLTLYSLYCSDDITAMLSQWRLDKAQKQSSLSNVSFLRVTHSLICSSCPGSGLFYWPIKLSFILGMWLCKLLPSQEQLGSCLDFVLQAKDGWSVPLSSLSALRMWPPLSVKMAAAQEE